MTSTRRVTAESRRRSEAGDTLVEILFAIVVFSMTAVAAFAGFTTLLTVSTQYRSVATMSSVLKSVSTQVVSQLQDQSLPLYATCATAAQYQPGGTNTVTFNAVPAGYSAQITQVQYWTGSGFSSTCPTPSPGTGPQPQEITVMVTNLATGAHGWSTFVIDNSYTSSSPPPDPLATQLAFQQQPGNAVSGANFTVLPTVAVENAGGSVLTNDFSVMSLSITSGSGTGGAALSSTCAGTESNGVFTFTNCNINMGGGYTLTATDGTSSVISAPFTVVAQLTQPTAPSTAPSTTTTGAIIATFANSTNAPSGQSYLATTCTNPGMTTGCVTQSAFTSGSQITGLTSGTNYYVTITANASTGYLAATSPASSATMATVQLTAPAVSATTATPGLGQLAVTFSSPSNAPAGQTYVATACTNPGMTTGCITQGSFSSGSQIAGLTVGTSYYVSIIAVASSGYLAATSAYGSSTAIPATVPNAPTNVTVIAGNGSASVSWSTPSSNGGSPITGYTVTATDTTTAAYSCPSGGTLSGTTCVGSSSVAATLVSSMQTCPSGGTLTVATCAVTSAYAALFGQTGSTPIYGYTCPSGGTLTLTTCVVTSNYAATPKYSCSSGLLSGSTCNTSTYTLVTVSSAQASNCQYPAGNVGATYYCGEYVPNSAAATINYSCTSGATLSGSTCYTTSSYGASYSQTGSANPLTGYACPSGGTLSGTTCTLISTYAATQVNTTYTCPSGGTLSGTTCTVISTYAATYQQTGTTPVYGYTCPSGGTLSGTTCTVTSTYAATYQQVGSTPIYGYTCPSGGTLSGTTCNTTSSYGATLTYTCPSGGTLSGTTCNTTSSYGATLTYSCPSGGTLSGTTCNTTGSYAATSNNSYSCPSGGSLSGTTCTKTTVYAATFEQTGTAPVYGYYCPSGWGNLSGSTCYRITTTSTQAGCTNNGGTWLGGSSNNCQLHTTASYGQVGTTPVYGYVCTQGGTGPDSNYNCTLTSTYAATNTPYYTCPSGGTLSGSTCNTTGSYGATGTYSCPSGGSLSGSTCTISGSYGATGTYSCPSGGSLSGSTCTISGSYAATYAQTGSTPVYGYVCNSGDTLSGTTCTNTSTYSATLATAAYSCSSGTLSGSNCVTTISYTASVSGNGGQTCTSATTSCTVAGLTNGDSYTFTVTATNSIGTSVASSPSSAVIPVTVPGAPTGVTATVGNTQSIITWTAPASNGGSAITGYTVTSTPGGFTCTTTGALTCTVTGLANGTSYTFTVTATTAVGNSLASTPSNAVVPQA